ncbi:melanocyte-stimulating hormone receptor-like [Antedon mediterranea]|uniref:melanocyte-stimulating hormone receptor-like n=1 Tax=Antedon mediterranea TaxID=105859 RepID=UPI003AF73D34
MEESKTSLNLTSQDLDNGVGIINGFIVYLVLINVMCVFSILANSFVLFLILATKKLRRVQNVFVSLLAFADASSSLFIILVYTLSFNLFVVYMLNVCLVLSHCSIACIAIDRYIALVWAPMKYHLIVTKKTCTIAVITVIIFKAVFIALAEGSTFILAMSTMVYMILNTTLYITIYKTICNNKDCVLSTQKLKKGKKMLITFCVIVLVFDITNGLTVLIHSVGLIFVASTDDATTHFLLYYISFCLMSVNALVNPIIYWFRLTEFRKAAKEMACIQVG